MTLRELFEVLWPVTKIRITGRTAEGKLIHEWIYGEKIFVSEFMDRDVKEGTLTIVKKKINAHGGKEMGWGVKTKLLPAALIDSMITHLGVSGGSANGEYSVSADVELNPIQAEIVPRESDY